MKALHDGHSNDELAKFTYENLAYWKILFQYLRSFVMAIRSRYLGPASRSNKVRCVFYTFFFSINSNSIQAIYEYIMSHLIDADGPSRLVDDNAA
jgi:hypothetical protein